MDEHTMTKTQYDGARILRTARLLAAAAGTLAVMGALSSAHSAEAPASPAAPERAPLPTQNLTAADIVRQVDELPAPTALGGFAVHSKNFCESCHGPNGVAQTAMWPHVSGQPFEVTAKALLEYRAGLRSSGAQAALMAKAAQKLSDQQIADVAALYAQLPGPDGTTLTVGKDQVKPKAIDNTFIITKGDPARAITPCAACHGAGPESAVKAPVLHGQNPAYLVRSLKDFKSGVRKNDFMEEMRFFAEAMTDDEIEAVSLWYGNQMGRAGTMKK